MAESRTEDLFIDLIKGTQKDFEPQSRFESYMKCIINKADPAETPKPESRKDVLMKTYAEQVYNGGGSGGSSFKVQTFTINADDITATGSGETIAYTLTESCLAPLKEGCLNAGKTVIYLRRLNIMPW